MMRRLPGVSAADGTRATRPLAADVGIAVSILAVLLTVPAALAAIGGFLWGGLPGALDVYHDTTLILVGGNVNFGVPTIGAAFATLYGAAVVRVIPPRRGAVIAVLAYGKLSWLANTGNTFWWPLLTVYVLIAPAGLLFARRVTAFLDADRDGVIEQATAATDGGTSPDPGGRDE